MSNKNISQFSLLTAPETGDFLLLWDQSAGLTYRVYVNDIVALDAINNDEWFDNIYVRNRARISGVIGGQTGTNLLSGNFPGILAGQSQRAVGNNAAALAGQSNLASGIGSIICGLTNEVIGNYSAVIGGNDNVSVSANSTILGGDTCRIHGVTADGTAIVGGILNVISGGSSYSIIAGGHGNRLMALRAAIIGGQSNVNSGADSAILAGSSNQISGGSVDHSALVAGTNNIIYGTSTYSTIIGGQGHRLIASEAAAVGGANAKVSGQDAVTIGGDFAVASGARSVVVGGNTCEAFGQNSVALGGIAAKALGMSSIAAGRNAEARENGAMIFSDNTASSNKFSYGQDSFTLNFSGGVWVTGGGLNARRGFNIYPTGDTPVNYTTPGRSGDFAYKDQYIYVYTGDQADSNRGWGRIQLSTLDSAPPSIVSNDSSVIHCRGDGSFILSDVFQNISFTQGGGLAAINPILSIPAGNATWAIDCTIGVEKGSQANFIHLYLQNTSDGRMIPNTSGVWDLNGLYRRPNQIRLFTITGTDYASAKNIQLVARVDPIDSVDQESLLIPTGTTLSYVRLR